MKDAKVGCRLFIAVYSFWLRSVNILGTEWFDLVLVSGAGGQISVVGYLVDVS